MLYTGDQSSSLDSTRLFTLGSLVGLLERGSNSSGRIIAGYAVSACEHPSG